MSVKKVVVMKITLDIPESVRKIFTTNLVESDSPRAEVCMWLYEKHGIWIEVQHCGTFNQFSFKISKLNKKNIKKEPHYVYPFGKGFNSPTEAYESAIKYTLENLI
jgi:hypothetical protein